MTRTFTAALLAATALVSTAQAQGYRSTIQPPDPQAIEDANRRAADREERRQRMFEGQKARQDESNRQTQETIERRRREQADRLQQTIEEERRLNEERARKAEQQQQQKDEENRAFLQRCPIGSPCWMQSGNRPQEEIAEWQRQLLERQKTKDAEEQREQARPVNKVVNAYAAYIFVRVCHESREGYLVQYISNAEMERAEKAVRSAVDKWKAADPSIDTALAWEDARKHARNTNVAASIEFCQFNLNKLYSLSGASPYQFGKPE